MSDYAQRGVMLVDMRLISSESHSEASGYLGSIPDCRQPFTSAWRNETDAWQADEASAWMVGSPETTATTARDGLAGANPVALANLTAMERKTTEHCPPVLLSYPALPGRTASGLEVACELRRCSRIRPCDKVAVNLFE